MLRIINPTQFFLHLLDKKNTYLDYKFTTVNESGERLDPTKYHLMHRDSLQDIIERYKLKRVKEN